MAAVVAVAFFACKKKEEPVETVETAVVEAPPEEPVVATPDEAGAKPVETPAEVAKFQLLDGLAYTITVVGWDNPFAATMCGRVLVNIATLAAAAPTEEEKATLAEVELELRAVKSKLDDVVAKGGTLTQEELDALKASLKEADAKLAGLYGFAPTRRLTEAEGDKLKEGYRLRKEKEKEGGDLRKEKWKEGGDELKRKKAEGEGK